MKKNTVLSKILKFPFLQQHVFPSVALKFIYVNLSVKTSSYVLFVRGEKLKPHKLKSLVGREDKCLWLKVKVKVKQSRYRPGVAQRVPGS
jgi:hypothetical protein